MAVKDACVGASELGWPGEGRYLPRVGRVGELPWQLSGM